jgi:cytochrome c oxidase cbb3-type subunit III
VNHPPLAVTLAAVAALLAAGCETRQTEPPPGGFARQTAVRQIELQPGQPSGIPRMRNPVGGDPHVVAEGKRLFGWYNCAGCHFNGGGGIGPPLMDDDWIYGSEPQNILASILEGRPNGMPSYSGRLPADHAWKIVAYVQSLSEQAGDQPDPQSAEQDDKKTERKEEVKQEARPEGGGETHP